MLASFEMVCSYSGGSAPIVRIERRIQAQLEVGFEGDKCVSSFEPSRTSLDSAIIVLTLVLSTTSTCPGSTGSIQCLSSCMNAGTSFTSITSVAMSNHHMVRQEIPSPLRWRKATLAIQRRMGFDRGSSRSG